MFTTKDIITTRIHSFGIWRQTIGGIQQDTFGKKPNRDSRNQFVAFCNHHAQQTNLK